MTVQSLEFRVASTAVGEHPELDTPSNTRRAKTRGIGGYVLGNRGWGLVLIRGRDLPERTLWRSQSSLVRGACHSQLTTHSTQRMGFRAAPPYRMSDLSWQTPTCLSGAKQADT